MRCPTGVNELSCLIVNGSKEKAAGGGDDPEQLRARLRALEKTFEADKLSAAGRLAGGVAHDLNNLLTPFLAYSGMLLEELPPGHPSRELMEEVLNSGNGVFALAKTLSALRVKGAGGAAVDFHAAVLGQLEKMKAKWLPNHTLVVNVSQTPAWIVAEAGAVERILEELIKNAQQATPVGGAIEVQTERMDEPDGTFWVLRVRDGGCGISEEVQAHMYEPYYSTRPKGHGKGMGLALAAAAAARCCGRIHCESGVGAGTTFSVFFPAAK